MKELAKKNQGISEAVNNEVTDANSIPGTPKNRSAQEEIKTEWEKELGVTLIENSNQGIAAFDKNLKFTIWNKTMESNTGIPKDEAIGQDVFDVFPEFGPMHKDMAQRALKGEKIFVKNQKYLVRNGYYDGDLIPLFNQLNEVIGAFAVIHDITDRLKFEEENTRQKLSQQKDIMDIILKTQEEERKRIAEGLHDGLGQLLYAMRLNLELLKSKNENMKVQNDIEILLNEAIEETRTISFELMPAVLNDFGLEVAIRELCIKLSKGKLKIYYEFRLNENKDHSLEISIFRIIQELLNNIMKHSKATKGYINIYGDETNIFIEVKDNGQGFNTMFLDNATGIGICSIRNRIKLLNGNFNIFSTIGKGTEVIIKIPKP